MFVKRIHCNKNTNTECHSSLWNVGSFKFILFFKKHEFQSYPLGLERKKEAIYHEVFSSTW